MSRSATSAFRTPGTLTQTFYLRQYGRAPSTRLAVLVFFEGNDLKDIKREQEAIDEFRSSGRRRFRELRRNPQHSFLIHVAYVLSESRQPFKGVAAPTRPGSRRVDNATLRIGEQSHPVTISYAPKNLHELGAGEASLLRDSIEAWGKTARELGLEPCLAFMPCKHRVFAGHLKFHTDADSTLSSWQPSDLPNDMQALCETNSISFVDLTPALVDATNNGVITYNRIWDTHLNTDGAAIVAKTLSEFLQEWWNRPKP